jgi:hypothetical protein
VPGGIEEFFAAQDAYFAQLQGPPDLERLAAIWAGHGRIVGPPIELDAAPAASRSYAAARTASDPGRAVPTVDPRLATGIPFGRGPSTGR